MKYKIKIKKYTFEISDGKTINWEEEYRKLEAHHKEETQELIKRIEKLEGHLEEMINDPIDSEFNLF